MNRTPDSATSQQTRRLWLFGLFLLLILALFLLNLALGSVSIPLKDIWGILIGREGIREWVYIVQNSRLPRALTALARLP